MTRPEAVWDAWPPEVVAERLDGLAVPWCVAAGWAVDLFLGTRTRPHGDTEIAVPAAAYEQVAARFGDCDPFVVHKGKVEPATPASLPLGHQTWLWERATGRWRLDVFREPHDGDVWVCRRDPRIRRPYTTMILRTEGGLPFMAPEVVLLFKAKDPRGKDEADFAATVPLLDAGRRRWLDDALALTAPRHPWRERLR